MTDGKLKSVKVYFMGALAIAAFAFLWFGKIDQATLVELLRPTLIAWLAAHVTQQVLRAKNGGA
jgi:hypothetical protein